MKKIIAVSLTLIFVSQTLVNVGIGLYYYLNKSYITQQLCENRKDVSKHCNGHCFLSKQLKKAEEGENKSAKLIKEKEEIIANRISTLPLKYIPNVIVTKVPSFNQSLYFADDFSSLLKPPAL